MKRTINQLEHKIVDHQKQNELLKGRNNALEEEIKRLNEQNKQLIKKCHRFEVSSFTPQPNQQNCDFQMDIDREIVTTLQQKIAIMNWQILQLQAITSEYEDKIINLQGELMAKQKKQLLYKTQLDKLQQKVQILECSKPQDDKHMKQILNKWQSSNQQKSRLIFQKEQTAKQNEMLKNQANAKIQRLIEINLDLKSKLQILDGQDSLGSQIQALATQTKQENQNLVDNLRDKSDLLNLYMTNSDGIDFTQGKFNDAHTIRVLRKQITHKGKLIEDVVVRMREVESMKNEYEKYVDKYNQIKEQSQQIFSQNQELKLKQQELNHRVTNLEATLKNYECNQVQQDKKIYQLLLQNEACHRLLHQMKGTQHYRRDLEEGVSLVLKQLEMRRMKEQEWTDVSQLITVNRRLRMINNE